MSIAKDMQEIEVLIDAYGARRWQTGYAGGQADNRVAARQDIEAVKERAALLARIRQMLEDKPSGQEPVGEIAVFRSDKPITGLTLWPVIPHGDLPPEGAKLYTHPPAQSSVQEPVYWQWRFVFPTHKGNWGSPSNRPRTINTGDNPVGRPNITFEVRELYAGPVLGDPPPAQAPQQGREEFVVLDVAHRGLMLITTRKDEEPLPFAVGQFVSVAAGEAPQQVRMLTSEELADCCGGCRTNSAIETWMRRAIAKFCKVNGIAQDQEGK